MRKKTVRDVMTHLDDAFMLSIDSVLDFETVSEIMKQGKKNKPLSCFLTISRNKKTVYHPLFDFFP